MLHNAFVLAILGQAFAATPAPDVLNARAAKSRDKRRPKKAKLSGSLPIKSHLRCAFLSCLVFFPFSPQNDRDTTGIRTPKKMWLGRERGAAVAVDGGSGSKERRELSQRVKAIADEEGIERVDEEAVDAIQNALHAHLLRLLKSAAPVSENNTTGGAGVFGGAGVKRERENNSNAAPLISRASLRVAVSKNGKGLLCDDLPLQREKLLLAE